MAFCQNCGQKLEEGAAFCPGCGAKVGGAAPVADESKRQQKFVGAVKKCPSCGAELKSFMTVCPECGHEINDSSINEYQKEFSQAMIRFEGQKLYDYIAAFQIPNTKEDLGNFITTVASILLTELKSDRADEGKINAFTSKFYDIDNKIKLLLPEGDNVREHAAALRGQIDEERAKFDKSKKAAKTKQSLSKAGSKVSESWNKSIFHRKPVVGFILGFFLVSIIFSAIISTCESSKEKSNARKLDKLEAMEFVVPQADVVWPTELSGYVDIVSDASVKVSEGFKTTSISLTVKCEKSIADVLDADINDYIKTNGIKNSEEYESLATIGFFDYTSGIGNMNTFAKSLVKMVPGDEAKMTINFTRDDLEKPLHHDDPRVTYDYLSGKSLQFNGFNASKEIKWKNAEGSYEYYTAKF